MSTQTGSISFESTGGFHSYAGQKYATLSQIKGQFATSSTGAATAAKVATIVPTDSNWELYAGATVTVKFTTANTAGTPTLNVNGTGAKQIRDYNGAALVKESREWPAGAAMSFTYDGTYWRIQDSNLMERMYSAETAIDQNATNITLKANSNDVYSKEDVDDFIEQEVADRNAAIELSANGITQTVSENYATKSEIKQINSGEGISEIITEDAAPLPLLSLNIYGKSVQDGTPTPSAPVPVQVIETGNLVNPGVNTRNTLPRTNNGVTFSDNGDGGIKVVGTATATATFTFASELGGPSLTPGDAYTLSGSGARGVNFNAWKTDGSDILSTSYVTMTVPDSNSWNFKLSVANGTTVDTVVYPMLTRGSTPQPYVPYGSLGCVVKGRNLLASQFESGLYNSSTGVAQTNATYARTIKVSVLPSTQYVISMHKSYANSGVYLHEWKVDGAYNGQTTLGSNSTTDYFKVFTTKADTAEVAFQCGASTYPEQTGTVTNAQLERGTTAHAYTPYVDSTTLIPLQSNVLASLPDGTYDQWFIDELGSVKLINCTWIDEIASVGTLNTSGNTYYATLTPVDATKRRNWSSFGEYSVEGGHNTDLAWCSKCGIATSGLYIGRTWNGLYAYAPASLGLTQNDFDQLVGATFVARNKLTTIDLGTIDLPIVADNSVVSIISNLQSDINGSWWTKTGYENGKIFQGNKLLEDRITTNETTITQTAEGINTNISQISQAIQYGGRNLLQVNNSVATPTEYNALDIYLSEPLESGQSYTLQLWDVNVSHSSKTAAQLGAMVYYCGGNVSFGGWQGTNYFTDGHADKLELIFTPYNSKIADSTGGNVTPGQNISHSSVVNADNKFIRLYNSVPTATGTRNLTVGKWKLERGSFATPWEYSQNDITTVSNKLNNVSDTVDGHTQTISSMEQTISTKADNSTVSTLTTKVNNVSDTVDGHTSNLSSLTQRVDTIANPNLGPYFSHDFTDVYNATDNPNGYWRISPTATSGNWTQLEDGWARLVKDNTSGTSTAYGNIRESLISTLKPSTRYTAVLEVRNFNKTGSGNISWTGPYNRSGVSQFDTAAADVRIAITGDGIYRLESITRSDFSGYSEGTSGFISIPTGVSINGEFRYSLYEGSYTGPYKPYVPITEIETLQEDYAIYKQTTTENLSNIGTRMTTAEGKITSAETAIQQNTSDITLRATKTEVYDSAQPNLSPCFSSSPYWPEENSYWVLRENTTPGLFNFTNMGDGWVRVQCDLTGETADKRCNMINVKSPSVLPNKDYTFLFEFRNNNSTFVASTRGTVYIVQSANCQFWGGAVVKVIEDFGTSSNNSSSYIDDIPTDGTVAVKRFVKKSEPIGSSRWTDGDIANVTGCVSIVPIIKAGNNIDFEMRVSIYPGEYTGPFKPYSGTQLYASQSELKLANDAIDMRVEKDGVIGAINLSSESATIAANKVNIEGAAIFTGNGRLSFTSLNNAYDTKGAAATVQTNLDNLQIGGRNLLQGSATLGTLNLVHGWINNGSGNSLSLDNINGIECIKVTSTTESGYIASARTASRVNLEWGQTYIASCWLMFNEAINNTFGDLIPLHFHAGSVATTDIFDLSINGHGGGVTTYEIEPDENYEDTIPANTWVRFIRKIVTSQTAPNVEYPYPVFAPFIYGNLRKSTTSSEHITWIRDFKIEKGNRATDWSPAPEDQTAYVDSINIGGRNYLRMSNSLDDTTWWGRSNITSVTTGQTDPEGGTGAVLVTPSASTWYLQTARNKSILKEIGETYTASVWLRADNETTCNICVRYLQSEYADSANATATTRMTVTVPTTWTRFNVTGILTSAQTVDNFWVGQKTTEPIYVYHPKMEKGNRATDWSPAPEDVDDSISTVQNNLDASRSWRADCSTAAETVAKVATITPATIAFSLSVGTVVFVTFSETNSAARGSITLNVNSTGAKRIKYIASGGNVADIPGNGYLVAGRTYQFFYDGTNWVVSMPYNTNNYDRENYKAAIAASTAIAAGRIGVLGSDGKLKLLAANAFDTTRPILYVGTEYTDDDVTAGTTRTSNYTYWGSAFNLTNTHAITGGAAGKPVYIVGEMNGKMFTPTSAVLTCTEPTSEDGKIYMRLGLMSTAANAVLEGTHPFYAYVDGSFREISPGGVLAEQYIYISKASGTTSVNANTTWVTSTSDSQNAWTTKRPTYATNYPVLFIAKQTKRFDGTVTCTTPLKDDTTTVIDGGHITTGTIDASVVTVDNINASNIKSGTLSANYIDSDNLHVKAANIDGTLSFGQLSGVQASGDYATNTSLNAEINQRKAQYGTCNTAAGTQAKVVTCSNFELVAGNELTVKFSTANTYANGAVQLNVNSKGAKNIWVGNAITSTTNKLLWGANAYITFRYDGTQFIVIGEPRTWYGACATSENTAAKTDTTAVTGCVICKGTKVELAMSNANTATSPTLEIQSTGALAIYFGNGTARPTKADGTSWLATNTCTFTFDGATWRTQGKTYIDANTIVTGTIDADRIDASTINIGDLAGEIGGTNLLRNTSNPSTNDIALTRSELLTDGIVRLTPTESASYLKWRVNYLDYADYTNDTYTFSFDARAADVASEYTTEADVKAYIAVNLASRIGNTISSSYDRYCPAVSFTDLTTNWKRFSITKQIPTDLTSGQTSALVAGSFLTCQIAASSSHKPVEVRRLKLERGSRTTDWTPAPEDQIAYVDNMQIGGRNLLRNSAFDNDSAWTYDGAGGSITNGTLTINNSTSTGNKRVYHQSELFTHVNGETYSVSFDVVGTKACTISCGRTYGTLSGTNYFGCEFDVTTTKRRVSGSYTATSTGAFCFALPSNDATVTIDNIKLERGNKATDWTLAPEDIDANIESAAKTATNYMSFDSTNGLKIASSSPSTATRRVQITSDKINVYNDANNYIQINTDGLTIFKGGSDVANFGTTARIGQSNAARFLINANSLQAYDSSNVKYFEVTPTAMTYGSNTVANTDQVTTAGTTASLFITPVSSTEIKVHSQTGKSANDYAKIDSEGLEVFKRNVSISKFSDSIRLGKESRTKVEIDINSLKMYDKDGNKYCHISDLRGDDGSVILEEESIVPDSNYVWPSFEYSHWSADDVIIYLNEVAYRYGDGAFSYESSTGAPGGSQNRPMIHLNESIFPAGSTVTIRYHATDNRLKAYTLGVRDETDVDNVGGFSFSEGYYTSAIGHYSHTEGDWTIAEGESAHAEGGNTVASGNTSHAEGWRNVASGEFSHAEGGSHFGEWSIASGESSHAEGCSIASGDRSHAESYSNAVGEDSHAENRGTASGNYSHAESWSTASGYCSHAEAYGTASGQYSHAEGGTASGDRSHAEYSTASGYCSHAQNLATIAASESQTALGKYNVEDSNDTYAVILGNGTATNKRSNALAIQWNGLTHYWSNSSFTRASAILDSAVKMAGLYHKDKNSVQIGYSEITKNTSNNMIRSFAVQNEKDDGTGVTAALYLSANRNGTTSATLTSGTAWPIANGGTGATSVAAAQKALLGWNQIATTSGTTAKSFTNLNTTGYKEVLVACYIAGDYLGSVVLPINRLSTTANTIFLGGGYTSNTGNRRVAAELSLTQITPYTVMVDGSYKNGNWVVYAR